MQRVSEQHMWLFQFLQHPLNMWGKGESIITIIAFFEKDTKVSMDLIG